MIQLSIPRHPIYFCNISDRYIPPPAVVYIAPFSFIRLLRNRVEVSIWQQKS